MSKVSAFGMQANRLRGRNLSLLYNCSGILFLIFILYEYIFLNQVFTIHYESKKHGFVATLLYIVAALAKRAQAKRAKCECKAQSAKRKAQ